MAHDRRKWKTRERILDAAPELFARRGFEGARVVDIARRAEVGHGTVFWHFVGKTQLYAHVLQLAGDRFLSAMRYTKIVTAGVGVDRNEFMDILEDYWKGGQKVAGYHNPSHGLPFDVVEAIDQKLFPSTDNLAEGLAREIIRAGWGGRIVGHSQGTLTVVNAVRMLPRLHDPIRVRITLLSPAVSYPTAAHFGGGGANYRQPWFDIANLWAPSLNPIKWASGFVDVLCGACVHRANGLGTE